jgi:hypothetical protein
LWKNQVIPIFSYQNLLGHLDGFTAIPPTEISQGEKTISNPLFSAWLNTDQKVIIILHSSLSEEVMAKIVGLPTARSIWLALGAAYSNSSVKRIKNLKDSLRQLNKGTNVVAVFGRRFKVLCDQLAVVGAPVDPSDQLHWFLCGLGTTFETFSTSIRTSRHVPSFRDLLAQVESQNFF